MIVSLACTMMKAGAGFANCALLLSKESFITPKNVLVAGTVTMNTCAVVEAALAAHVKVGGCTTPPLEAIKVMVVIEVGLLAGSKLTWNELPVGTETGIGGVKVQPPLDNT